MPKFVLQIISRHTGNPVPEIKAEVFIIINNDATLLSKHQTNAQGQASVEIEDQQLNNFIAADPEAFIFFKVYKKNTEEILTDTQKTIHWLPNAPSDMVTIPVEMELEIPNFNYTVKGIVKDSGSGLPLKQLIVKALIQKNSTEKQFAETITNEDGAFTFKPELVKPVFDVATPEDLILFRVFKQGEENSLGESKDGIHWLPNFEIAPLVIEVNLPQPLTALNEKLRWNLSQELISFLQTKNITTIADVRKSGGVSRLPELPVPADKEEVQLLDAQGRLSVLPTTTTLNNDLYNHGFNSVNSILALSHDEFVTKLKDITPAQKSNDIYEFSYLYGQDMINTITAHRAHLNGGGISKRIDEILADPCTCNDCLHAASPSAYLADLLKYTLDHLRNNGNPINLTWLEQRFHQPFRSLPADCTGQKQKVRQVRICIEVLRDILPAPYKTSVSLGYLERVYRHFLELYGTSYEEVREARVMNDSDKKQLVARLQLPWLGSGNPFLDTLYMDLNASAGTGTPALSENWIEQVFGLKDTTQPPLTPVPNRNISAFADQRLIFWFEQWRVEDTNPATYALGKVALLDPDNISVNDVVNKPQYPVPPDKWGWNESNFLVQRRQWIELAIAEINQYRNSTTPAKTYDEMLTVLGQQNMLPNVAIGVMNGIVMNDLLVKRNQSDAGTDIENWLLQKKLSKEVFTRLSDFALIEKKGLTISEQEWSEFNDMVIQRAKELEVYSTWRQEERRKNLNNVENPFTITSKHFKLNNTDTISNSMQWVAIAWRSDPAARRIWKQVLKARIGIEQTIIEQAKNAIETVEDLSLVFVRDELLRTAATLGLLTGNPGSLITQERLKWFTRHFQIDAEGGGCRITTRVAQAIETLQGVLNGARNGLLEDTALVLNNIESFDKDWQWIGTYATWKAAMMVFLYPENILRPTLRREQSPGFRKFIESLRNEGNITPKSASGIIREYEEYFQDICHLQLKGFIETAGGFGNKKNNKYSYLFAQVKDANRFYWTYRNDLNVQNYWYRINLNDIDVRNSTISIIGTASYIISSSRFIYIFLKKAGPNKDEIIFARCNIDTSDSFEELKWSPYVSLQKLPNINGKEATKFDFAHILNPPDLPPQVAIWLTGRTGYTIPLNKAGNGFSNKFSALPIPPGVWKNFGNSGGNQFRCSNPAIPLTQKGIRFLLKGDFDKDGQEEVAAIPEAMGSSGNDIWIMKYDGQNWVHLNPFALGHPREADLDCSSLPFPIKFAVAGDFDYDGADEIAVCIDMYSNTTVNLLNASEISVRDSLRSDNCFWVWKWNKSSNSWSTLGQQQSLQNSGNPFNITFKCEGFINIPEELRVKFAVAADFDGDRADEIAIAIENGIYSLEIPAKILSPNNFFVMALQNNEWVNLHTLECENSRIESAFAVAADFKRDNKAQILVGKKQNTGSADATTANDMWFYSLDDNNGKKEWTKLPDLNCDSGALSQVSAVFIVSGDFDNDGSTEVAAFMSDNTGVWIRKFDGTRWIAVLSDIVISSPHGNFKYALAGDFDGDEADEIIVVDSGSSVILFDWVWNDDERTNGSWKEEKASPFIFGGYNPPSNSPITGITPSHGILMAYGGRAGKFLKDSGSDQFISLASPQNDNSLYAYYYEPGNRKDTAKKFGVFLWDLPFSSPSPLLISDKIIQYNKAALQAWSNRKEHSSIQQYLEEMFFFVPLEIAIRLQQNLYFNEALDYFRMVYDYSKNSSSSIISFKLFTNHTIPISTYDSQRILDPLDVHFIANNRQDSYLRYSLLNIIRCLLEYGDSEFTKATSESLAQAINFYLKALELLNASELNFRRSPCTDIIGRLDNTIGEDEEIWVYQAIAGELRKVENVNLLQSAVEKIELIFKSEEKPLEKWAESKALVDEALNKARIALTIEGKIMNAQAQMTELESVIAAQSDSLNNYTLEKIKGKFFKTTLPAPPLSFCIPPNPLINTLRKRTENNLLKLRTCRNIAGLPLKIEPYASPTLAEVSAFDQLPVRQRANVRPLPYRYGTLIERTKQLIELARQMEQSMLQFISAAEQEHYQILKARQDIGLARAGVKLRELQKANSENGVISASLQFDRAQIQFNHYSNLINAGVSNNETTSLSMLGVSAGLQTTSGILYAMAGFNAVSVRTGIESGSNVMSSFAQSYSSFAGAASTTSSIFSTIAQHERRAQEWKLTKQLSREDILIARQQIAINQQQVFISQQEQYIAELQATFAEQVLEHLSTGKFLNYDLYEWMSSVMEGIYRFFLQQATALAQIAENQLAFERQEVMPGFIKADYWEPISEVQSASNTAQTEDRRGLTGSARLLRDIYELDQHAFRTNRRKLQLSETFSLLQLDPVAFRLFLDSGVLNFDTPMKLFDSKFPGHYLRLIRRIRISVIALIPPILGIKATLANIGSSKVVLGPDNYETVDIRRDAESIAFTSPISATGLFELDAQPELLIPFEGIGVDSRWQFEMPKAANQFDFETIADVLFTVEYTALNSYEYRQEIIKKLPKEIVADRVYSFRNNLADAWYDLNNPDLTPTPMEVKFKTTASDFPPNIVKDTLSINHITINQVTLYFVKSNPADFTPPLSVNLEFTEKDSASGNTIGGQATTTNGILSTRSGNASAWISMTGKDPSVESIKLPNEVVIHPYREWVLTLPKDRTTKNLFKDEKIKEILLVITYSAQLPMWPM